MKRQLLPVCAILLGVGMLFTASCESPIVQTGTVRVRHSSYTAEFPYEIRVNVTQEIRSGGSVHKRYVDVYVLMKRAAGKLTTGEFAVGYVGSRSPMLTRGIIVIEDAGISIEAEVGQRMPSGSSPSSWSKSLANGRYRLVRN